MKLLTVAAVADRLAITRQSVYRLTGSGALPSVRVSKKAVRIDEADLAQFIASRRTQVDDTCDSPGIAADLAKLDYRPFSRGDR